MAFARGSQRGLYYVAESVFGETPVSPEMTALRNTGDTLALSKQTNQSGELRADRAIADLRHGNKQVGGDVSIELSYGAYDALLEGAMFSSFAPAYDLTLTLSVDAVGKTITDDGGGDFVASGVEVGDEITLGGFTNPENNGNFVVTAVSGDVITIGNATGLVTESAASGATVTARRDRVSVGTTLSTFTIEKALEDIGDYLRFTGMAVNGLSLSVQPNAMVTGSLAFVGRGVTVEAGALDATPTAAPTASPFDGFTGSILEGGSAITVVTGIEFSLDNGIEPNFVLMSDIAAALTDGRANITGTVTTYVEDATMLSKFVDETESSLQFTLVDSAGNSYRFTFPRVKYSGADLPVSGEGPIVSSMPFQALYDATAGTALIIDRAPAVGT